MNVLLNSYFKVIFMAGMPISVVSTSVDIVRYPRESCSKEIL